MYKVEDNIIYITRGDIATIEFSIYDYVFQVGDTVLFSVYAKQQLNKSPLLRKEIKIEKQTEIISIELSVQDTKSLGPMKNEAIECWYEVELNGNQTPLGFDEDGAKVLILYPEGADISNE